MHRALVRSEDDVRVARRETTCSRALWMPGVTRWLEDDGDGIVSKSL
jgi:hypothetical protein